MSIIPNRCLKHFERLVFTKNVFKNLFKNIIKGYPNFKASLEKDMLKH